MRNDIDRLDGERHIAGYDVAEEAFAIPHDLARTSTPTAMWLRSLPVDRNPISGDTVMGEVRARGRGLDIVRGYAYVSRQDGEDTHVVIADEQHAIIFGDSAHDPRIIADVVNLFRAEGVNPYIAVIDEEAVREDIDEDFPF